jgi:D-serine deaminase-like pyridoxal phosphate-dependent protein
VSTVAELELLFMWLIEAWKGGRNVDVSGEISSRMGGLLILVKVIYGIPTTASNLARLKATASQIEQMASTKTAEFSISVLVDSAESIPLQAKVMKEVGGPMPFYIKVDCGYNRAGVLPDSEQMESLLNVLAANSSNAKLLRGLYTHLGSSYNANSLVEAANGLLNEIRPLEEVAKQIKQKLPSLKKLVLSVGATPTATAAQNFLEISKEDGGISLLAKEFEDRKRRLMEQGLALELHAGCYPILDMQQLATHARPDGSGLSHKDVAIRIAAEVVGRYYRNGKHEALIGAGSLALGREPCKSYPGWGVVAPNENDGPYYDEENQTGWIVGRISQEHGILTWEGDENKMGPRDLKIGDRVMIWPNHACIAGAQFDWYLVTDSDLGANKITNVWTRCRGW